MTSFFIERMRWGVPGFLYFRYSNSILREELDDVFDSLSFGKIDDRFRGVHDEDIVMEDLCKIIKRRYK